MPPVRSLRTVCAKMPVWLVSRLDELAGPGGRSRLLRAAAWFLVSHPELARKLIERWGVW